MEVGFKDVNWIHLAEESVMSLLIL
jgi:hypothetical protein